jgi:GWxTD domain-containing protein
MVVNLIDRNRNANQLYFIRVDKTNTYNAQNYLLVNQKTGEPFFGGFVPSGSAVEVWSERNLLSSTALKAYILNTEIKLPPPPFSQNQPEIPNFENSRVVKSFTTEKSDLVFNAEDGCYLITCDPEKKTGLSFSTTSVYYPNISHTNQLPWPMRYITTKAEYDDIIKSNNSKVLIDNFWLECAGSKERAKDMIRIYYSRVEEANHFFSTYTEGWRTDRGMMHVVFGNPSKIIKQEDSETWIYGEEGQVGTLAFGFKKMDSPLSNNIYILNRDPMFKMQWERMVTTWRNGRVFND